VNEFSVACQCRAPSSLFWSGIIQTHSNTGSSVAFGLCVHLLLIYPASPPRSFFPPRASFPLRNFTSLQIYLLVLRRPCGSSSFARCSLGPAKRFRGLVSPPLGKRMDLRRRSFSPFVYGLGMQLPPPRSLFHHQPQSPSFVPLLAICLHIP